MADLSTNEDTALRYVLGELNDAERREFESLMTMSAELRTLVSELESGAVAMANAAPRRRTPAEIWQRIEKAVVKETRPKLAFPTYWFGWLRNGWAVSVVCLIGWLFYAFSVNRHLPSTPENPKNSQPEVAAVTSTEPSPQPVAVKTTVPKATNDANALLQARMLEIMELRGKIAQLETAKTQLSRSLTQQQALLTESNRIKFYNLSPASPANANANTAPLSPGLQRAVFMALAREQGWLPAPTPATAQTGGNVPPTSTTIGGVDFVDLRPGSQNVSSQPQSQPQAESGQTATGNKATAATPVQPQPQSPTELTTASPATVAPDPTIPAFVSGNNLVVALDSSVVPAGSSVSLSVLDANQNAPAGDSIGSFTLGNNPTVVTMPFNSPIYMTSGYTYGFVSGLSVVTMNFQTPGGQIGTIQFFAPVPTNP